MNKHLAFPILSLGIHNPVSQTKIILDTDFSGDVAPSY